jgi:hypothetical protein
MASRALADERLHGRLQDAESDPQLLSSPSSVEVRESGEEEPEYDKSQNYAHHNEPGIFWYHRTITTLY